MSATLFTRRQALRQTFFYSAALALARNLPAVEPRGVSARDLHFLMLGDFGSHGQKPSQTVETSVGGESSEPESSTNGAAPQTTSPRPMATPARTPFALSTPAPKATSTKPTIPPQQKPVADAMISYVQAQKIVPEGLFLLGDNFYGQLKGGVSSPRWQSGFEEMYPASSFPGPCWAMLGNHDYDEETGLKLAAELAYADAHPGTRWKLPSKWYRVDWPAKDPLITCLVLDSNYKNSYIYLTAEERGRQMKWLQAELAKPRTAPWLVCMGHHPLFSNGPHGDQAALIKDWGPLFQKYDVPFYFCGHDHDLQHLQFSGMPTSFVVSGGGGGAITKLKREERGPFSQSVYGFTHLQVSPDKFIVRHIDPQLKQLHGFQRSLNGRIDLLRG